MRRSNIAWISLFVLFCVGPSGIPSLLVKAEGDDVVLTDDDEGESIGSMVMSDGEDGEETPEPATTEYAVDQGTARLTWMLAEPASMDQITFNEPVRFLVNIVNEAKRRQYKFHKISASFRYPADPKYVLFNMSAMHYEAIILPGEVHTFKYEFKLMDEYTARSVIFILNALYSDDLHRTYDDALVNQTILIQESKQTFDLELLFMYIVLIGLGSAVSFAIYQFVRRKLKSAGIITHRPAKRDTMLGPVVSKHDVDMDWISKEHIKSRDDRQSRSGPRKRAKASETNTAGRATVR